jgi:hypothetical protein
VIIAADAVIAKPMLSFALRRLRPLAGQAGAKEKWPKERFGKRALSHLS